MIKVENGVEYLDYDQAAIEYGLSRNSIPPMVSRGVFTSKKFPDIVNKYISREQLEAYKSRKDRTRNTATDTSSVEKERFTQDAPFLGKEELRLKILKMEALHSVARQMEQIAI